MQKWHSMHYRQRLSNILSCTFSTQSKHGSHFLISAFATDHVKKNGVAMSAIAAGNGQVLLKVGDGYCTDMPQGVRCKAQKVGPAEKFTVGCVSGCSNTEFGTCSLIEPNCNGSLETQTNGPTAKTDNKLKTVYGMGWG